VGVFGKRARWKIHRKAKMNNYDYFQIEMDAKNYISAALLAIKFSRGKCSKSGAWEWAGKAVEAAEKAGITLDAGNLSWPDWDKMSDKLIR